MGSYIREREMQLAFEAMRLSRHERKWLYQRYLKGKWLRCNWCERWGKHVMPECLPADVPSFLDMNHRRTLLCGLCRDRAYPLLTLHFFRGKFPIDVARLIEMFAYPEWASSVSTWLP